MPKGPLSPEEEGYVKHIRESIYKHKSTDRSAAVLTSPKGRAYLVPRVWEGKTLTDAEVVERVRSEGKSRFPSYESTGAALARAKEIDESLSQEAGQHHQERLPTEHTNQRILNALLRRRAF